MVCGETTFFLAAPLQVDLLRQIHTSKRDKVVMHFECMKLTYCLDKCMTMCWTRDLYFSELLLPFFNCLSFHSQLVVVNCGKYALYFI